MNPDTQLNHYRIVAPLGEGGMGQVYRAEDTRLKRQVAIKVLPPEVAGDPERLARLEREAQLLAQLEHPNVAAVYGLEEADGTRFLVMQLVDGETLADRIAAGSIPVASAMSIALQIAEGLEAAHERGIVHRDLKPANVMVSESGAVKVLDFGLAKAGDPSASGIGSAPELTASPTMMAPTQAGVILGTAAYMSPEQARGRAVDKRTDIWAFGCVLYEMLTASQGFGGETVTDILAAIVHKEVDLAKLPAETPWQLRELLERCLAKDPVQRLRDIGDARIALQEAIADPAPQRSTVAPDGQVTTARRSLVVAAAAAAAAVLLTTLALNALRPAATSPPVRRFELPAPGRLEVRDRAPRISPDGRRVVMYAAGQLWVRDLGELSSRPLPGTADATFPFWSPDSREVGFFVEERLWRIAVDGGERVSVTRVGEVEGGFWGPDGQIYFGRDPDLARVPALGGDAVTVVPLDHEAHAGAGAPLDLHAPFLLPDGRSLLYRFHSVETAGSIMIWDGTAPRDLLAGGATEQLSAPIYSPTGHILYQRSGTANAGVWAVPFDVDALELTGTPFPVADGHLSPSLATDGSLLTVRGADNEQFVMRWLSLDGALGDTLGGPMGAAAFRMAASPQGDRVAVVSATETSSDIWVHDERGGTVRVTSHEEREDHPVWGPAGDRLVYTTTAGPHGELWLQVLDGNSPPERLAEGRFGRFTPDGRRLVFVRETDAGGGTDIWTLDLQGAAEPAPWLETPESERLPAVSPDGTLIAYASDVSGENEIHVRNFADGTGRRVVSTAGGNLPQWSPDGRTLYYIAEGALMAVSFEDGSMGAPVEVLSPRMAGLASTFFTRFLGYAIHPEGDRVLVPAVVGDRDSASMVLTQNWWTQFAAER